MAIVSCLVDTNILVRIARRFDPQHKTVDNALARLAEQGTILHYTHQNIAELFESFAQRRHLVVQGRSMLRPSSA